MMKMAILVACVVLMKPCFSRASDEPDVPTHVAYSVEKGSALDVSFLIDAPAGSRGAVRRNGEHLRFGDGTLARFWGVNFAWEAQYPEEYQIQAIVNRLRSSGINLVRLTYLDHLPPKGLVTKLSPSEISVDEKQMDRLDRFAAALANSGIYMNVVLMMAARVSDITPALVVDEIASLQMFHPDVIAAHRRWVELFLTHRNPYTGRIWAEEPALAYIEIYNEGDPFYLRKKMPAHSEATLAPLHQKWLAWCRDQGVAGNPTFDTTMLDGRLDIPCDQVRFLSALQEQHLSEMRALIRRCGYQGPICDVAGGSYAPAARWAQRDSDLHVAHYYHDHPQWDARGAFIRNRSACEAGLRMLSAAAWERDLRRPYILGEWDYCYPNQYRAEGVPLTAAFAAMQGWTGCLQFTYWSRSWDDSEKLLSPEGRIDGIWRIMNDPAVMAVYPAAALMFLRGDVQPCTGETEIDVDAFTVFNWPPHYPQAFQRKLGTRLSSSNTLSQQSELNGTPSVLISDTQQVIYDTEKGVLTVNSPRSQMVIGMLGGHQLETEDVAFEIETQFAVVAVSSLTEVPIQQSQRLLVTAVAQAHNTGFKAEYQNEAYRIVQTGKDPILAQPVRGSLLIRHDMLCDVFALDPSGRRIRKIGSSADGRIQVQLVPDSMHYEITTRTP